MQPETKAIRKRTQIDNTNKVMFLWVAGTSVLFGIVIVVAIFLTQMLMFNERVLTEKSRTASNLEYNIDNIKELQDQVRLLDTNQALIDAKSKPEDRAVQVILDALPSEANSLALGASLQRKLLSGINEIEVDSLQLDQVVGVESLETASSVIDESTEAISREITFRFTVTGNEIGLKKVLLNLEKSIRTIDVTNIKIEGQTDKTSMTIHGRGFYEPARELKLMDKVVK